MEREDDTEQTDYVQDLFWLRDMANKNIISM